MTDTKIKFNEWLAISIKNKKEQFQYKITIAKKNSD